MKRCPKCNQVYADELMFCLADGTPLGASEGAPEEPTMVRPANRVAVPVAPTDQYATVREPVAMPTAAVQKGGGAMKFVAIAIGLLLLLGVIGIAAGAFLLWPRGGDVATVTNTSNGNAANGKSAPAPTPVQTVTSNAANANSNTKDRADELERERKRLADERKKLEDERRRLDEQDNKDIREEDDPPDTFKDPGPSRLAFRRGSTGTTVSGTVGKARSYVLRTMDGQYLNASVRSPGGCVIFSSGGSSTQFSTGAGDTYLYLKNTCDSPSTFSLSVNVR